MGTIKLNYVPVTQQIKKVAAAKDNLELSPAGSDDVGKNTLQITEKWKQHEREIQELVTQYMQVLNKNIQDTQDSVELLKKQDESIIKR